MPSLGKFRRGLDEPWCVDDEIVAEHALEVAVRLAADPDNVISKSIIRRHAAENLGDEFDKFVHAWLGNGKRNFKRVVIELTPTKVFAWNNRKTAAARRRAKTG